MSCALFRDIFFHLPSVVNLLPNHFSLPYSPFDLWQVLGEVLGQIGQNGPHFEICSEVRTISLQFAKFTLAFANFIS
jgi:hypothetical protein